MKVGMFAKSWSPDWDYQSEIYGAKVAAVELLEALLLYSQQVQVYEMFVPSSSYPFWTEFAQHQIQQGAPMDRLHLRPAVELPRALREETFAAFHTHGVSSWGNLVALRELAKSPFVCTTTMHAISPAFLLRELGVVLGGDILRASNLICSSQAQKQAMVNILHCISKSVVNVEIREKWDDLITVIPLGVNTHRFVQSDKSLCRKWAQLPEEGPIILCLGRLSASTKMDLIPLFRAFRSVLKAVPTAWLLLVGQERFHGFADHLLECTRELEIEDRTIILNGVPESIKPAIYNSADVFVSLSDNLQESFGVVLLEAMACGLPIIATDWNGYRDIVQHGNTGYLVPTWWGKCDSMVNTLALMGDWEMDHFLLAQSVAYSIEELSHYLIKLLEDSDLRCAMGLKGRERVEREYEWKMIIARYEHIWQRQLQLEHSSADVKGDFNTPTYWDTFNHYSSHRLSDKTAIVLTDFGRNILSGAETLLRYTEIELVLDDNLLDFLMNRASSIPITKYDLCQLAGGNHHLWTDQLVTYHIMWLMKQGVINFISNSTE